MGRLAEVTGWPIAPEYLERVAELYWLLVDGLASIEMHDLGEVEPVPTFSVRR